MKTTTSLIVCLLTLFAGPALAQKWVVYTPPERDFRVLFPTDPVQATGNDGSVAFRAQQELGEGNFVEYVVYRLPASVQRTGNEAQDIEKVLQGRLGEGTQAKRVTQDDPKDWPGYAFEYRRYLSMNRLVAAGGRSYLLEVLMPRSTATRIVPTARDFFSSFQSGGINIPGVLAGFTQKIETWCQGRTDAFTRAFCEYSVCLQPGFDTNPKCTSLIRR